MFQNYIGEQNINFFKALLLLHVCFFPLYNLGFRFFKEHVYRTKLCSWLKIQIKIDSITNRHLDWICKIKVLSLFLSVIMLV